MDEKKKIVKSAYLMSLATFVSRVLGFLRDMIIAKYLGASGLSDAFFVAFRIPNLMRELFAEGAMSSSLIPVLSEYNIKSGHEETARLVRVVIGFILLFVGCICLLGIVFSPQIVMVIAPGFIDEPLKFRITVLLTRIMFPFLFFVSLAALTMGVLNARKVFFVPALASAWFNAGNIGVMLLLIPYYNYPVEIAAIGVTFGGLIQFLWQVPEFFKYGYSMRPIFRFDHPGLKKMGMLLLPATMGMAVSQLNIFIGTILASYLPEGSVAYLYYAMRLVQFPVGVFGVTLSVAMLPSLSEHASRNDIDRLRDDLSFSLRVLFAITIPSMTGLIALAMPIVNILYQRGEFQYNATLNTTIALVYLSMGIWAMVGARMLTSAFYAMQDTRTPVKITVISLALNVCCSIILMGPYGYAGLAIANAITATVNFGLLSYHIVRRIERIRIGEIAISLLKTTAASVIMGIMGYLLIGRMHYDTSGGILLKGSYLFVVIAVCTAVYFAMSIFIKNNEVLYIYNMLRRRL